MGPRERGGERLRAVVFAGIAGAAGLVAYGLARYPGLRTENGVWASVALFISVLAIYGTITLALSRGMSPETVFARRYGLAGGVLVGVAWLAALAPPHVLKAWVALPLATAVLAPACIAGLAARRRDATTGTRAALWSGIVGGLGIFVVWVTTTYARNGGPYDAGMLRDFHNSKARDLATYAVSDNLGSALVLLLLVPMLALAIGSLTAQLASGER